MAKRITSKASINTERAEHVPELRYALAGWAYPADDHWLQVAERVLERWAKEPPTPAAGMMAEKTFRWLAEVKSYVARGIPENALYAACRLGAGLGDMQFDVPFEKVKRRKAQVRKGAKTSSQKHTAKHPEIVERWKQHRAEGHAKMKCDAQAASACRVSIDTVKRATKSIRQIVVQR